MENRNMAPQERLQEKLHSSRGISRLIAILLAAVIVMAIVCLIPIYQHYQTQAATLACATGLDTARRQLADKFMFDGFENGDAEDAKEWIAFVMNGWDDLCPDGGDVYIVHNEPGSALEWDVVCGLHCADKKLRTRLNSENVLQQLRDGLHREQLLDNPYPESLEFTLHHRQYTAYLVDEATNFKRGTDLTKDYEGIVAFYSIVGHSDFGADSGLDDGELWYFSYADENHCATWTNTQQWTGDSYKVVG